MIYILGGNGFVGSAFIRLFERERIPYQNITRDKYEKFKGTSCDIFINANGNSKKFLANQDPKAEFEATVKSVCFSLHDFKYKKYVLCSTCDVYNSFEDDSLNKEESLINIKKQSRYGFHKYIAENFVQYEAPDFLIIRFGGFVGPNLVKNPIFDILKGGPLWLSPESELQYLHTDEAAKIVWSLIEKGYKNEIFNVCGTGLIKLQDIINFVGKPIEIKDNAPKVIYNINTEKINKVFDSKISQSSNTVLKFIEEKIIEGEI